jgi:GntR family transcriptional regulator of abcA and norABC
VSESIQVLQLISVGILHPGSTVFIEKPSYLKFIYVFQSAGINLKGLSIDKEGIIPIEMIKKKYKNIIFLCFFTRFKMGIKKIAQLIKNMTIENKS